MKTTKNSVTRTLSILATVVMLAIPQAALAHCDSLDGPVITDARAALAQGEIFPVLKWVSAKDEHEIRKTFEHTMAVRGINSEAKELADMYFFETLVRVHRAGEGAPYTGLKAEGTTEPVVVKADHALEHGSADKLIGAILQHTEHGIQERFTHALETKKHADDSVQAGREFVEAYVNYVHYLEEIANVVHGKSHHAEETAGTGHQH